MISDAYRFIFPILVVAALLAYFGLPTLALVFVLLAGFVAFFFRNPTRSIPSGEGLIVSPADGRVVAIEPVASGEVNEGGQAISIFLNIFDVHVNRSPIAGLLEQLDYRRGEFRAAYDAIASKVNEQNVLTIQGQDLRVVVKQIAGLIARRVVCWRRPGDALQRGELFGLIRFGSRVDVLLPPGAILHCKIGDRVRGGSSVLAGISAREAEVGRLKGSCDEG